MNWKKYRVEPDAFWVFPCFVACMLIAIIGGPYFTYYSNYWSALFPGVPLILFAIFAKFQSFVWGD